MIDRIHYEDQADWAPSDCYSLWRYFDRLAEYVGPTRAQAQRPEYRSARISTKKTGVRDEELAAIDLARMPAESQWLLRAVLFSQQRYELALEKFPNLGALSHAVPPSAPRGYAQYPASVRAALDPVEARRESMADIVASWDLEGARPDEQGMQIVRDYYIRGKEDERGVAVTCDVPGGPGAFSARARALTQNTKRDIEALHYRQSFSDEEFDPKNPEDVQRVNDLGYLLAKKMHPDSDCLVVTHTDGRRGKAHNHILVINHNSRTGKALSDYRTFHDRKAGNQRGVQSANDELMREHGLSVVKRLEHAPKDWELRREDFAEGGLDREMGDRMSAALADPRAVNKAGLEAVIAEQNQQLGDDDERVPRMRLHTAVSKRGKNVGKETWTLYIEDRRGESGRAERRKRTSALSADFTPEGAQAFFDYHQQQREQEHERSARQVEAAERAGRAAAAARQSGDDGGVDLDPRRR